MIQTFFKLNMYLQNQHLKDMLLHGLQELVKAMSEKKEVVHKGKQS